VAAQSWTHRPPLKEAIAQNSIVRQAAMRLAPLLARFLSTTKAGVLARLWHRLAPSFPVRRRVFGFTIYYDFRDHPYYWIASRRNLETMESIFDALPKEPCQVWDVGSNVGIFSLRAAQMGHTVTAFDISAKALGLLARSAEANGFNIRRVCRALATTRFSYQPPVTSDADNRVTPGTGGGPEQSLTFSAAAQETGVPQLIKMDIEGAEAEFLDSPEFKQWIQTHDIAWIVEIHGPEPRARLWPDVPLRTLDGSHVAINDRTAPCSP